MKPPDPPSKRRDPAPVPPSDQDDPTPRLPLGLRHWVAIGALVVAAAIPIARQFFGLDLCAITDGVGISLDACVRAGLPVPEPAAAPRPDGGT